MRVAIPHSLPKAEVRRRMEAKQGDIAGMVPGGMAQIETQWVSEDRMAMVIKAMGQVLNGHVDIEETQAVFDVELPPALSFVEPMIAGTLEQKGRKLLS